MGLGDQPPKALKKNPLGISLLGGLFLPDMNEGFVPGLFMSKAGVPSTTGTYFREGEYLTCPDQSHWSIRAQCL